MFERWFHKKYSILLNAYVDGELPSNKVKNVEIHLENCAICRTELENIKKARNLLRIQLTENLPDEKLKDFLPQLKIRLAREDWKTSIEEIKEVKFTWKDFILSHRMAFGSALAAVLIIAIFLWQPFISINNIDSSKSVIAMSPISINYVETENPNSSIMVFTAKESNTTVIWIFGLEES